MGADGLTISDHPGARVVTTSDLDRDGDLDVLSASQTDGKVAWFENDGAAGGWVGHTVVELLVALRSLGAADLDGDGDADLLAASDSPNQLSMSRQKSSIMPEQRARGQK